MIYHELPEANPIESVLKEQRVFSPARSFAAAAHIKSLAQYRQMYQESIRRPDWFWARQVKAELRRSERAGPPQPVGGVNRGYLHHSPKLPSAPQSWEVR